jgi:hypothetical protein
VPETEAKMTVRMASPTTGNLGPLERRKRFALGVVGLVSACGLVFFTGMHSVFSWVILFLLFWVAGLGLFQAKEKT